MTKHYNKSKYTLHRKELRNNPTDAEKRLWYYLKGKQLSGYKFRRQYGVDHFILDFYCPALKLGIEVDGSVHDQQEIVAYDKERQMYIESFGITILRIKNEQVLNEIDDVLNWIENKISELTITTPISPPYKGGD
jgi:very-short-patch-repair endonuclease